MKLSFASIVLALGAISSAIAIPTGARPFRAPRERVKSLATRTEPIVEGRRLTNAQRFKAGLPPLPPRFKIPGSPTRRVVDPSATVKTGPVTVYDLSGTPQAIGVLSRSLNGDGCFGLSSSSDAMIVEVAYTGATQSGRQVVPQNYAGPSPYTFLGAASGATYLDSTFYSACMTMVAGPPDDGNSAVNGVGSQSNIWRVEHNPTYAGVTYQDYTALFAAWNPNGPNFLYDKVLQRLLVSTLSASEYKTRSGNDAVPIGLTVGPPN